MNKTDIQQRSYGISLARVVCAFGIILFHYLGHISGGQYTLFANGSWGTMLVFVFFLISGYVLYLKYPEVTDIKQFYYRRFRKILPMYWLAFIPTFIDTSLANYSFEWGGHPATLFLSFIGMDGFFYGYFKTFYVLGEWFLGAIIICYLVYPLLTKIFKKLTFFLPIILIIIGALASKIPVFQNTGRHNLLVCIGIFTVGMTLARYRLADKLWFRIIAVAETAVLWFTPLSIPQLVCEIAVAVGVLTLLYMIGNLIGKNAVVSKIITLFDGITYPMYLLHHLIMLRFLTAIHPDGIGQNLVVFLATTFITIAMACVLKLVTETLLKMFDRWRMKQNNLQANE